METAKGIYLSILKSRKNDHCQSGIRTQVFFYCEGGYAEPKASDYIVEIDSVMTGKEHFFLSPANKEGVALDGGYLCASGNFAYASDSRFKFEYPLCIHDHFSFY